MIQVMRVGALLVCGILLFFVYYWRFPPTVLIHGQHGVPTETVVTLSSGYSVLLGVLCLFGVIAGGLFRELDGFKQVKSIRSVWRQAWLSPAMWQALLAAPFAVLLVLAAVHARPDEPLSLIFAVQTGMTARLLFRRQLDAATDVSQRQLDEHPPRKSSQVSEELSDGSRSERVIRKGDSQTAEKRAKAKGTEQTHDKPKAKRRIARTDAETNGKASTSASAAVTGAAEPTDAEAESAQAEAEAAEKREATSSAVNEPRGVR